MNKYYKDLEKLNSKIWDSAELKFQEYKSAKAMIDLLKENNFEIKENLADMETAFIAKYGQGEPVIGYLAEFDALSGLSQMENEIEETPIVKNGNGHGCGHSLLGTGSVGASLKLKDYIVENKKEGTVILIGCPAEEGGSGKAYLARDGVFDNLDVALTWHPAGGNAVVSGSMQANCQVYFRFKGISSHAASAPHLGRSALDAVELMNIGTNYLREHMEDHDRIHYAITDTGGISPNVIPNRAEVIYLIRSINNDNVKKLYERICNVAKGAALMTETKVEIIFDKACSNVIPNKVLEELLYETMKEIKLPEYNNKELDLVKNLKKKIGKKEITSDLSLVGNKDTKIIDILDNKLMSDFIMDYKHSESCFPGSTDVGDCSHVVPTAQIVTACFTPGTPLHSWIAVSQGKSATAFKAMIYASDVLYNAGKKLIDNPKLIIKAKDEFIFRTDGKKYISPIPMDVKPNQNAK